MVTDEKYKELEDRVIALEGRFNELSRKYSRLRFLHEGNEFALLEEANEQKEKDDRHKCKDVTKYMFKGKKLSKRELVLQCVREYVDKNPKIEYAQLTEKFPDYVQGSLGIVKSLQDAEIYKDAIKRFYFSDKDIIHLVDGDYVVCNQWDSRNIGRFLKLAEDLGFEVQPIQRKYR